MNQSNSLGYWERAMRVIPGGTQTLSKMYSRYPQGVAPAFISNADGAYVWDIDGNRYIDWSASLGPVTIGYGYPPRSFYFYCQCASSLPLAHPIEVELAERLIAKIPCAEMVRFFKTGSDATSAAIRLARAVTGRKKIVCIGYHGWHDWYAETLPDPKSRGVYGQHTVKITYGEEPVDLWPVAALVIEPMSREYPERASREYLLRLQELCRKTGTVLVFDEIIMGYRHALAGGQEFYGVTPDLATFSKGMGNGYPISALVGKRELMQDLADFQVSGTFFGDAFGMKIAFWVLDFYERHDVISHLWDIGNELIDGMRYRIQECRLGGRVSVKGFGPWCSLIWKDRDDEMTFLKGAFERGIFCNRDHFAMWSHTDEDARKTLAAYDEIFYLMGNLVR